MILITRKNSAFRRTRALILAAAVLTGVSFTDVNMNANNHNSGNPSATISPYKENPRYWQLNGAPIFLIGGSNTDAPFQLDKAQLTEQLDALASAGGNYLRNVMSDRGIQIALHNSRDNDVYAFAKVEENLFDLNAWNNTYWQRFQCFLDETARRGIIVQLELWDRHDFSEVSERSPRGWGNHPWNPKNNINYSASESILREEEESDHTKLPIWQLPGHPDDPALKLMQRFIAKVMEISLRYDHVLYTMDNEASHPASWGRHWSDFVKGEAKKAGKSIQRAPMLNSPKHTVNEVLGFPDQYEFADISQVAKQFKQDHADALAVLWQAMSSNPIPLNNIKQYGGTMELWFTPGLEDEGAARAWRTVFSGGASVRFHRPPAGLGIGDKARAHIAALRTVTNIIPPWNALPHHQAVSLLSGRDDDEAYIMADSNRGYAVYMPHDAAFPSKAEFSVEVDVNALPKPISVRWYDIEAGLWDTDASFHSNNTDTITLKRPSEAHWVAIITPVTK